MRVSLAVKRTLATVLVAALVALAIPPLDPPANSADLRPGLAILAGVALIFAIWVATFGGWVIREIRRD